MMKKNKYWTACIVAVILLTVIGYTPLMIPKGVYKPMILGIPYSLWVSFLITAALVTLTYLGSKYHPGRDEEEDAS